MRTQMKSTVENQLHQEQVSLPERRLKAFCPRSFNLDLKLKKKEHNINTQKKLKIAKGHAI